MKVSKSSCAHYMIYFATLWGSVHAAFARECRARQEELMGQVSSGSKLKKRRWSHEQQLTPQGISALLSLDHFARRHTLLSLIHHLFFVARYLAVRLTSLDWFRAYHLLDCFLLGRVRTIGRMYLIGPLAASIFQALFFIYRRQMSNSPPGRFHFHVFEFLLHDYHEVLANEIAYDEHKPAGWLDGHQHEREHEREREHEHGQQEHHFRVRNRSFPAPEVGVPGASGRLMEARRRVYRLARDSLIVGQPSACPNAGRLAGLSQLAQRHDALFYAPNSLLESGDTQQPSARPSSSEPDWILRPNRTSASWQLMHKVTLFCLAFTLLALLNNLVFITLLMLPPTNTRMGFEIYYPACARWLKRHQEAEWAELNGSGRAQVLLDNYCIVPADQEQQQQQQQQQQDGRATQAKCLNYSSIHLALGHELACDRAISDTPILQLLSDDPNWLPWTGYQLTRFLVDALQSYIFYIDFSLNFCAHLYILLMISLDVVLNALDIKRRLLELLAELRHSSHHDHDERIDNKRMCHQARESDLETNAWQIPNHSQQQQQQQQQQQHHEHLINQRPSPWQVHKRRQHEQLNEHIMSLQSLIMDHFKLVRTYNQFVSHYLLLLLVTLFAFSGAFTVLILTLKDQAIELEFLVCELLAIAFIIQLFAGPCVTHIFNHQLNALISSAMALDSTSSLTKSRWIILLNHYQPAPLYCFTLFQRTPVSWLFCLKLFSWCFSAGFVLANFLYVYKDPS